MISRIQFKKNESPIMSFTCDVQELAMQFSTMILNHRITPSVINRIGPMQRYLIGFDGVAEA